jgi:hypothetical protein
MEMAAPCEFVRKENSDEAQYYVYGKDAERKHVLLITGGPLAKSFRT